jgi:uncharacterized protein (DUF302 family)
MTKSKSNKKLSVKRITKNELTIQLMEQVEKQLNPNGYITRELFDPEDCLEIDGKIDFKPLSTFVFKLIKQEVNKAVLSEARRRINVV